MAFLVELWLPILLAAVFVFVVSSVIHMLLPIHKKDYRPVPNEDGFLDALRGHGLTRGSYTFPHAKDMKEMGSPEMIEKFKRGPVGWMTVLPNGVLNCNKSLAQWFVFSIVMGIFAAYVTRLALAPGADFLAVLRISGTVAVVGYGVSAIPDSIWKGQCWGTTLKFVADGVLYGVVTGLTFAWLWPAA